MRRQAEAGGGVRVLVACEFSAVVRDAFRARGHDAYSCDLLGTEGDSAWHITGDVFKVLKKRGPWDMMLCFPPCTYVAVSGARWFSDPARLVRQRAALEFMRDLLESSVPKICMENPIGIFSTYYRKPDQIVQPWQFGHPESKATCLWLKNLPPLVPTKVVRWKMNRRSEANANRIHHMPPGPQRWKNRSRTFQGIANAMADQWSPHEPG
jgi:site-specific DNA-cytosine methylase